MINMPLLLKNIIGQINKRDTGKLNTGEFYSAWNDFLSNVRKEIPGACIEDDGASLSLGAISPGCRLCKDGAWDCIFMTNRCNLNCGFCISSLSINQKGFVSSLGKNVDELIDNYSKARIRGISFSGGEALLSFDELISMLVRLKNRFPGSYFWLYTNGVILTKNHIDLLSDSGIDEIRFNLAATGYDNKDLLDKVSSASIKIKNITVEIPAIWEDINKLLTVLETWTSAGVKYLNLHELMREQNSNSSSLKGNFKKLYLEDGHITDIELKSKSAVLETMRMINNKKIPLNLNFCSIINKFRQLSGRRNIFVGMVKSAEEKQIDNDYLESVIAFKTADNYFFVHPDNVERVKDQHEGYSFTRIRRTIPLSLYDKGTYISVEKIL